MRKITQIRRAVRHCPYLFAVFFCLLTVGCTSATSDVPVLPEPGLIIYTSQEEEVYAPIIKEFTERTGISVQVQHGTTDQLTALLSDPAADSGCDIIFGVTIETLESRKELWQPYESPESQHISESFRSSDNSWTAFSTLPLVIMYNTNLVTYRELPTGWGSLLEPRWKGRMAFVNPENSEIYAYALMAAVRLCPEKDNYLQLLAENINYQTLEQISDANNGVATGQYSLCVTLEESAQMLINDGADIDYIYPSEGTIAISDGAAIIRDCPHPDAAKQFLDFIISSDTQRILVSNMNRRSVRDDVTPLRGLSPIRHLPLIPYDLTQVPAEQEYLLSQWRDILEKMQRSLLR